MGATIGRCGIFGNSKRRRVGRPAVLLLVVGWDDPFLILLLLILRRLLADEGEADSIGSNASMRAAEEIEHWDMSGDLSA